MDMNEKAVFRSKRKPKCLREKSGEGESVDAIATTTREDDSHSNQVEYQRNDIEEDIRLSSALDDIRDLQKMRARSSGLSSYDLAYGKELSKAADSGKDPLKLKSGGLIDMKSLTRSKLDNANIEDDIKRQFSRENNLRDEDDEMRKYVEEELAQRTGSKKPVNEKASTSMKGDHPNEMGANDQEGQSSDAGRPLTEAELLQRAAGRFQMYKSRKNEEMLSNTMLTGIPEVELGIETKIKNIEETEALKLKLLKESLTKRKNLIEATSFRQDLAYNLSQQYVRHRAYAIDETTAVSSMDTAKKPLQRVPTEQIVVVGESDTPRWTERPVAVDEGPKEKKPKHTHYEIVHHPANHL